MMSQTDLRNGPHATQLNRQVKDMQSGLNRLFKNYFDVDDSDLEWGNSHLASNGQRDYDMAMRQKYDVVLMEV